MIAYLEPKEELKKIKGQQGILKKSIIIRVSGKMLSITSFVIPFLNDSYNIITKL